MTESNGKDVIENKKPKQLNIFDACDAINDFRIATCNPKATPTVMVNIKSLCNMRGLGALHKSNDLGYVESIMGCEVVYSRDIEENKFILVHKGT